MAKKPEPKIATPKKAKVVKAAEVEKSKVETVAKPAPKKSVTEIVNTPPIAEVPVAAPVARYFDLGESVGRLNEDGTFTDLKLVNGVQTTTNVTDADISKLKEISKLEAYSRVF